MIIKLTNISTTERKPNAAWVNRKSYHKEEKEDQSLSIMSPEEE